VAATHTPSGDGGIDWRRLASDRNVSLTVAKGLWERARTTTPNDPAQAGKAYEHMLEEAVHANASPEPGRETQVGAKPGAKDPASLGPGKWTRSLLEGPKPAADAAATKQKSEKAQSAAPAPATAGAEVAKPHTAKQLHTDLVAAVQASKNAADLLAASDPATIAEALRELQEGEPGILQKIMAVAGSAIERIMGKGGLEPKDKAATAKERTGFAVGAETHHIYVDEATGVVMMASTPKSIKERFETEWKPRLALMAPEARARIEANIQRAEGIEAEVADLAKKAKAGDKAADKLLPNKQAQLAAAIQGVDFQVIDPLETLKQPNYTQFKARFVKLAADLGMSGSEAEAQALWLQVVKTLQKTHPEYQVTLDLKTGYSDLTNATFQKIIGDFDPIIATLTPYIEKFVKGKTNWAFWSGKAAKNAAIAHAEVCLESSPFGSLFDGININGIWDMQMWGALSRAFAAQAASKVGAMKLAGFVGHGSSREMSIFNKIEQPHFAKMIAAQAAATPKIDWYAVAGDPKTGLGELDRDFSGGGLQGTYKSGDRASMVALAESENTRRLGLWTTKKQDEGVGGKIRNPPPPPPPAAVAKPAVPVAPKPVVPPPPPVVHAAPAAAASPAGPAAAKTSTPASPTATPVAPTLVAPKPPVAPPVAAAKPAATATPPGADPATAKTSPTDGPAKPHVDDAQAHGPAPVAPAPVTPPAPPTPAPAPAPKPSTLAPGSAAATPVATPAAHAPVTAATPAKAPIAPPATTAPVAPTTPKPAPDAVVGGRVPLTVKGEAHTQYLDPSGKPMVASTPTPVTAKLSELTAKLDKLPATDPEVAAARTELTTGQALETQLKTTAEKAKTGDAAATAMLPAQQAALAASVAKIWTVADPGPMDAKKAKEVIDSRNPDKTKGDGDISAGLAKDWVGKQRAAFESQFLDNGTLHKAIIDKHLGPAPDAAKMQTVGSKDPIAIQKFKDIDTESHIAINPDGKKKEFYIDLHAVMVSPAFTDRERTYPAMRAAAGFKYNCLGAKIPPERVAPISSRNHSMAKIWDAAHQTATTKTAINNEITTQLTVGGKPPNPIKLAEKLASDDLRKKTYYHLIKTGKLSAKASVDPAVKMSKYGPTWYAPGEIKVDTSTPPNQEFTKMMTLGALQPEWYPEGTAVLKIDMTGVANRVCLKPTAFDGLMSALWTSRNLTVHDYGVTGGGLGEFLEADVTFGHVSTITPVIPTDDFLADIQRVIAEVKGKLGANVHDPAHDDTSTPTEELVRGNGGNTKILNTAGNASTADGPTAKAAFGSVIDKSTKEQNKPSATPAAPGATAETSAAAPAKSAAAGSGGAYDRVDGPRASKDTAQAAATQSQATPTPTSAAKHAPAPSGLKSTSEAPGKAKPGSPVAPEDGGQQANDARKPEQTAAGATAKPELGGKPGETVADAAKRLHPDSERDSHFNPKEKVAFERALVGALLGRADLYTSEVDWVSTTILTYFEERLAAGIEAGLSSAHKKYMTDLAALTSNSKPGWWGAVETAASATKEELALQTRQSLTHGSLPQKLAVHQNFINVLVTDFKSKMQKAFITAFLGAAPTEPWFVRQQTRLKDGELVDGKKGKRVFKDENAHERGRSKRSDTAAVSPAGPGIAARDGTGADPDSVLAAGSDPQQVYRGIDAFTMDEGKAFCQRARLQLNMPLAAGVSGSTAELMNVAMTLGLNGSRLQRYAVAVLAYIGGGGNHSYHEIAVVLAAAGLKINPDNYSGVETLVGTDLFEQLKAAHPNAFPTQPAAPKTT
jgi:hypothetical protein